MAHDEEMAPLLTFQDGVYALHEPTLAWLEARREPFAVLACAGKFRTGKSFLLNRLLRRPPGQGFGVGETVQACTRGIWLCKRFLKGEEGGVDVLVMDTEGIDALDATSENDVRVFALAVLLCSAFAYNSMSHLDEAAVQTLNLMTQVADAVGDARGGGPTLYWMLRDFALQLVDAQGKPLSHGAYLEEALGQDKCATRAAIKRVFPQRHLVTLPRPHKGDSAQKLDGKGASALQPKFDKFLDQWRAHLCAKTPPVTTGGGAVPMTGSVYVAHCRNLVAKVNAEGALPKLEDAWTLLAKVQHADAERGLRDALLARVEEQCPHAPDAEVAAWARARAEESVSAAAFAPPAPDRAALASRLADEAVRHARALGRVRDAAVLAHDALEAAAAALHADGYRDPTPLLPTRVEDAAVRTAFCERALSRTCVELWPRALAAAAARAREEAEAEYALVRWRAETDVEALRAQLHEAEEARRQAQAQQETRARGEDACVGTEDLDPPPLFGGGAEAEEEEEAVAHAHHGGDARCRVAALEAALATADERAAAAEATRDAAQQREAQLRQAFDEGVEGLRADASARVTSAEAARDAADAEARSALEQKRAIEAEADKLRGLAREAQEGAVGVHKDFVEEMRRRDAEARTVADAQRRTHAEAHARAEGLAVETRGLKRRVDELLDTVEEAKRLRAAAHATALERARDEVEREALRAQAARARQEKDALRAANLALENRVAVLEATQKLESARRALL